MNESYVMLPRCMPKIVIVSFLYVLIAVSFAEEAKSDGDDEKMDIFILPTNTKPELYELLIAPKFNGAESTFDGETKIILMVNERTNSITLNAINLTILEVSLELIGDNECKMINVISFECVKKNQQLVIYLEDSIEPDYKYKLFISFKGEMSNDYTGFYLSSYNDYGVIKWCAATRFLTIFARRTFPCFDEPELKAIFIVTLLIKKCQIGLSNMPILCSEEINNADDEQYIHFLPTPLLSTSHVGFFVGEYSTAGLPNVITVFTHGEYLSQTGYIETEAPKLLQAMYDYTDTQIDLPKVDLVDIQGDNYEAVHNYGLQCYQDILLLFNCDTTTISQTDALCIIQHRLSMHWFGNLVTCKWWDSLWVFHGFNRYFEYFALQMAKPNWPTEELFLYEVHQKSMQFDIDLGPIHVDVKTPEEIESMEFLTLSFKPAAIFRMLRYIVSEKLFQLALQDFLNSHKYGVAIPDDLYLSFDKVLLDNNYEIGNEMTVKEFMAPWTQNNGYPYINVSCDKNENTFKIAQSKFPTNDDDKPLLWFIGLTYTTQQSQNFDNCKPTFWTDIQTKTTTITGLDESEWYIFNLKSTGLYRVNYLKENWIALAKQLNENIDIIPQSSRAALIDDAFSLAYQGLLKYEVAFCLITFLKYEENPLVWFTAMNNLYLIISNMLQDTDENYNKFVAYVMEYFGIIQQKLENMVSKGNTDVGILRAWDVLSTFTCQYGQETCVNNALFWFKQWEKGEKISANIREAAFCTGLTYCLDQEPFYRMLDLFMTSTSLMEKQAAALGLGCSSNKDLLKIALEKILLNKSKQPLKEVEYSRLIGSATSSLHGYEVMFEFLSTNLDELLNEVPGGTNMVKLIFSSLAVNVTKDSQVKQMKNLKDDPRIPSSIKPDLDSSFDGIGGDTDWFKKYHEEINQIVSNKGCCAPYIK